MNEDQSLFHVERATQEDAQLSPLFTRYAKLDELKLFKAGRLWASAKVRAKKLGVPFSLTRSWVEDRIADGICQVTGIEFVVGGNKRVPFCPSLDRKVAGAGYTNENCQMVVWIYNSAKSNGTHEDVMCLVRALAGGST